MPWDMPSLEWTPLNAVLWNAIPWNTMPLLAVVVAVSAAIGFGPLLMRKRAIASAAATNGRVSATAPKQAIVEVFDAENVDDIAMAHVIRLLRDGKLELAKTALDLAIAQRGQP